MSLTHGLGSRRAWAAAPAPAAPAAFARRAGETAIFGLAALAIRAKKRPTLSASLILVGALAAAAPFFRGAAAPAPEPQAAPAPIWAPIVRPLPIYSLEAPELARLPDGYSASARSDHSARRDLLTFGEPRDRRPFAAFSVRRGAENPASLYVEAARRASEFGLSVEQAGAPRPLATRFGPAEASWLRLRGADFSREGCAAFRVEGIEGGFAVSGLACGPDGAAFDAARLTCLIGRLDLLGAGDDAALKNFFAQAEQARDGACGAFSRAAFTAPAASGAVNAAPAARAPQAAQKRQRRASR